MPELRRGSCVPHVPPSRARSCASPAVIPGRGRSDLPSAVQDGFPGDYASRSEQCRIVRAPTRDGPPDPRPNPPRSGAARAAVRQSTLGDSRPSVRVSRSRRTLVGFRSHLDRAHQSDRRQVADRCCASATFPTSSVSTVWLSVCASDLDKPRSSSPAATAMKDSDSRSCAVGIGSSQRNGTRAVAGKGRRGDPDSGSPGAETDSGVPGIARSRIATGFSCQCGAWSERRKPTCRMNTSASPRARARRSASVGPPPVSSPVRKTVVVGNVTLACIPNFTAASSNSRVRASAPKSANSTLEKSR